MAAETREERCLRLPHDVAGNPHDHVMEAAVLEVILDPGSADPRDLSVNDIELPVVGAADLPDAGARIFDGDGRWLALALGFEVLSFVGHIVLFRAVSLRPGSRIGMRESYQITLAGHAATRLFASAGAGGVALTAWALRRSGMERREVGSRMVTFLVLLYSVYMAALIAGGLALFTGLLPGASPAALTLIPAALGAGVIAGGTGDGPVPRAGSRPRLRRRALRDDRAGRFAERAAGVPRAIADGVSEALRLRAPGQRRARTAPRCGGRSTSPPCGRASARSASRRPSPSWCSATSSACSPTRCRCPAASAASTAA